MKIQQLALFFLVATAIGGVAWVFLLPLLSGERNAERRRASVARAEPVAARSSRVQKSRREQVEESLKELDARNQKSKNPPLEIKIEQAGLTLSKQKFIIFAASFGLFAFVATFVLSGNLM